MIGRAVGAFFVASRDAVARGLLRLHVTPNMLSLAGTALTVLAGACFAASCPDRFAWSLDPAAPANAYPLLAVALLLLSCACDMLDGAVARIGNLGTRFGGFLDSTLDRYSDAAVFAGIALYYARSSPGNVTFVLLCMLASTNAFLISYTRARAVEAGADCPVGYWQRGERMAAVLIGSTAYHIPAMLLQQAILTFPTVLCRVLHAKAVLEGRSPITDPRKGDWRLKIRLWRWPRMTVPYDLVTAANIAWLVFAPVPATDYLRAWLGA